MVPKICSPINYKGNFTVHMDSVVVFSSSDSSNPVEIFSSALLNVIGSFFETISSRSSLKIASIADPICLNVQFARVSVCLQEILVPMRFSVLTDAMTLCLFMPVRIPQNTPDLETHP